MPHGALMEFADGPYFTRQMGPRCVPHACVGWVIIIVAYFLSISVLNLVIYDMYFYLGV